VTYTLCWNEGAKYDLRMLGKAEALRIVKKLESHLVRDPLSLGKPLSANLSGIYRYRIGNYRVLYQVIQKDLVVMVVRIGHRKEVYG